MAGKQEPGRQKGRKVSKVYGRREKRQIYPGLNAYEMHALYNKHHEESSLIKVYQNTHNSDKYEVVRKWPISRSHMKYLLKERCHGDFADF